MTRDESLKVIQRLFDEYDVVHMVWEENDFPKIRISPETFAEKVLDGIEEFINDKR